MNDTLKTWLEPPQSRNYNELKDWLYNDKAYIIMTNRAGNNEYNMSVEKIGRNFIKGKVTFNRFVIAKRSGSKQSAKLYIGTLEESQDDDVIAKEECVFATNSDIIANVQSVSLIETNWRPFLSSKIISGDGNILDVKQLVSVMPRFSIFSTPSDNITEDKVLDLTPK